MRFTPFTGPKTHIKHGKKHQTCQIDPCFAPLHPPPPPGASNSPFPPPRAGKKKINISETSTLQWATVIATLESLPKAVCRHFEFPGPIVKGDIYRAKFYAPPPPPTSENTLLGLVARAICNAIRANRFARIIRN